MFFPNFFKKNVVFFPFSFYSPPPLPLPHPMFFPILISIASSLLPLSPKLAPPASTRQNPNLPHRPRPLPIWLLRRRRLATSFFSVCVCLDLSPWMREKQRAVQSFANPAYSTTGVPPSLQIHLWGITNLKFPNPGANRDNFFSIPKTEEEEMPDFTSDRIAYLEPYLPSKLAGRILMGELRSQTRQYGYTE